VIAVCLLQSPALQAKLRSRRRVTPTPSTKQGALV